MPSHMTVCGSLPHIGHWNAKDGISYFQKLPKLETSVRLLTLGGWFPRREMIKIYLR